MKETRTKSYNDAVDTLNDNHRLSNDDAIVIFLSEIAGSLAVIADCMTEKKGGDTNDRKTKAVPVLRE